LPAALAPLIGIHLYLLRKHGEFGSEFEYSKRLAELRERRQIEEYALYEDEFPVHEDGHDSSRG